MRPAAKAEPLPFQWFKLTTNLDGTTHEADANPGTWTPSDNGGEGALDGDMSVTQKVRDTTGLSGANNGNWVPCQRIKSTNGIVWEIVSIQKQIARRVKGVTSALVAKSSPTFTVTSVTVTDDGIAPSGSQTIANPGFCIDSGATFYAEWDSSLSTPGYRVYDAPCSTNSGCG